MYNKKLNHHLNTMIEKAKKQIELDKKTNPLIEKAHLLNDYFLFFKEGFKLVALVPTIPTQESIYSYIATTTKQTNEQVIPAHLYINPHKDEIDVALLSSSQEKPHFFLFTSEIGKLFSYEKTPHFPTYHYVKKVEVEIIEKYILDHPVIVLFMGNDDTHYGIRFKTEQQAMEFLSLLNDFEDIQGFQVEYHN